jgi:hypothetical protein
MYNRKRYSAISAVLSIAFVFAFAGAAFGQQAEVTRNVAVTQAAAAATTQADNAPQNGHAAVDIDPTKTTAHLPNPPSEPSPLKAAGGGSARIPFQRRVIVQPTSTGFQTAFMPIPAGKRLVIENISAIARTPVGLRMEMNYFTYFDNGSAQGGIEAITFHRIALTDQGTFGDMSIASASDKVLVFAEEQIGTTHYQVGFQARLNGTTTGFAQAQITFSGYLEDLTIAQ